MSLLSIIILSSLISLVLVELIIILWLLDTNANLKTMVEQYEKELSESLVREMKNSKLVAQAKNVMESINQYEPVNPSVN